MARLFRYPEQAALVNRMGFNNDGADAIAARLDRLRKTGKWPTIPVGINLGKSKDTPLDEASADYLYSFRALRSFGDYFVINELTQYARTARIAGNSSLEDIVHTYAAKTRTPACSSRSLRTFGTNRRSR